MDFKYYKEMAMCRRACTQLRNWKEGAQSAIHSLPEINLNINFKAQNRKTKTETNPIADPNRYRRCCPDPNSSSSSSSVVRIRKFYTLYLNTTKEFT